MTYKQHTFVSTVLEAGKSKNKSPIDSGLVSTISWHRDGCVLTWQEGEGAL